ncbi:gamma-glutamyltransferase [Silvanigrella sp.]|jgi:gamma-glutamyltranspeptidase/glutathione hydrolase|uniref:gamma-glutamyltransferase n=1 Tax=Silvanigrella sp. TaxID=2024976 RepID=UPI0037CBC32A
MKRNKICLLIIVNLLIIISFNSYPKENKNKPDFPITETTQIFNPVFGKKGMVVTQEEIASHVGAQILSQGGNAVDAAVAVGYALAVTLPKAGNIGGGGFMLIWLNKQKKIYCYKL